MSARSTSLALALVLAAAGAWYLNDLLSRPDTRRPAVETATHFVTLTDGTRVEVPVRPVRVLPANASAVDVVVELLDPARIAALPRTAFDYSSISDDPETWSEHGLLHNFTSEEILAHAPDIVLTQINQDRSTVERLRASGVLVYDLPVVTDWEGLLASVELGGLVLGESEAAARVLADLEQRRSQIDAGPAAGKRVLPYGNYGGAGYTAGSNTTWELMVELAGMRNAASDARITGNAPIDFEQVLVIAPDLFVVGSNARSGHSPSAALLLAENSLASLASIEAERVVILPDDLYSTASHRLLDAAEELARLSAKLFE